MKETMKLTFDDLVTIERLLDSEIQERIKDYREVESLNLRAMLEDSIENYQELQEKVAEMRKKL